MKAIIFLAIILTVFAEENFDYVRKYLLRQERMLAGRSSIKDWLENSNTIGFGYNPLLGSPACYSDSCQSDAYRRSIFTLTYKNPTHGSCTSKLIPDHVELHCIPSSELVTNTETISTVKQLSESISNTISFGVDAQYKGFSAGYSHSRETRFMIDHMMKDNSTSFFTTGKVIFGKLSMFEPFMQLSDTFRFAIKEMPCCVYDNKVEQYIREFIIDYFGFTFVSELTLGGIAKQTLFIKENEMKKIQQKGRSITHSVSAGFIVTFNAKHASAQDRKTQEELMQSVTTSRSTKLGGDPSIKDIDLWIKSVPDSPAIMNIAIKGIKCLLTSQRFPDDPLIKNKAELLEKAIQSYLSSKTPVCLNNCTDSMHGYCDTSNAQLLFGTCKCYSNWEGVDCSEQVRQTHVIEPQGGPWGDYKDWAYCPHNTWAIGFKQRVEAPCGKCDDTALNSVVLICGDSDATKQTSITSYEGIWGTWGTPVYCNGKKNYLRSVQFRIESRQGKGDDTAANDSKFGCTNGETIQASNGAPWGSWGSSASCPPLTAICGLQIKFERNQGDGDDTAMNGAKFMCCTVV